MFGVNSYAKIKEVVETKENYTVCKISISKKDKQKNAYETTFMGKVTFCGQAHLQRPISEQRIKITNCAVQNCYVKDNKLEFLKNPKYVIFAYELQEGTNKAAANTILESMDDDGFIPF